MKQTKRLVKVSSILLLASLSIPILVPHARALTGLVCIADPLVNPSSCPSLPASFSGTVGSTLNVAVNIQGSDTVNGFDISTIVDESVLQPLSISIASSIIHSPDLIVTQSVDPSSGIARLAIVAVGYSIPAPVTGNLFTIAYKILTANRGTEIVFQTGCSGTTSVPNTCVIVTSPNVDSEMVQNGALAGPITPNFAISASLKSQTLSAGSSTFTNILVDSINGFSGTVGLSTQTPPICPGCPTWSIVPTSVSLSPDGAASANFTFHTTTSTPAGTYNVFVNGTSGTLSHSVILSFIVTTPDFSISASPASQNVPQGQSATASIVLTSQNGFSGTVNLATSPQLACPSCPSWSISPPSVTLSSGGTGSSTLSFTSFAGGPTGTFNVNVTGTSGSLSHSTQVVFTVVLLPTFSLASNPSSITIRVGQSGSSMLTITSLNGFSGTVTFSLSIQPLIKKGPAVSLSPTIITLQSGGTATAILSVSTNGGTQTGTYTVTVTATSGSITQTTTVTITILSRR